MYLRDARESVMALVYLKGEVREEACQLCKFGKDHRFLLLSR